MDEQQERSSGFAVAKGLALGIAAGAIVLALVFLAHSSLNKEETSSITTPPSAGADTGVDAGSEPGMNAETEVDVEADTSTHVHAWVDVYKSVEKQDESETVHHEAEYEDVTVIHTVCNECMAVIDGKAAEHIAETGHVGYTTGVEMVEQKLVKEAYDEVVTNEDAEPELVFVERKCKECGVVAEQ